MSFDVQVTDEFSKWWDSLNEDEVISMRDCVKLLRLYGPQLRFPYSSGIEGTKIKHMRELRVQHRGAPYRMLYAFNPKRNAILLIGGNKKGDKNWYKKFVPKAEQIYLEHLRSLEENQYVETI